MTKKKESNVIKLENVYYSIINAESTDKELDKELLSMGFNTQDIVTESADRFGKMRAKMRLDQASNKKGLIEKAKEKLAEFQSQVDNPIEKLMQLLGTNEKSASLQGFFSKIESLDKNDALDMIDEITLIDIIKKLEEGEK